MSTVQEQLSQSDYYTVKKGDTLASISKKTYGDTGHVEAICKMNGLSDGNLIFIGQKYCYHSSECGTIGRNNKYGRESEY